MTDTTKGITALGTDAHGKEFYFTVRKDMVATQGQALTEAKEICLRFGAKCKSLIPYHFQF